MTREDHPTSPKPSGSTDGFARGSLPGTSPSLLAALSALIAFSIDAHLPCFPDIAAKLGDTARSAADAVRSSVLLADDPWRAPFPTASGGARSSSSRSACSPPPRSAACWRRASSTCVSGGRCRGSPPAPASWSAGPSCATCSMRRRPETDVADHHDVRHWPPPSHRSSAAGCKSCSAGVRSSPSWSWPPPRCGWPAETAAGNAAAGKTPVAAPGLSGQHLLAGVDSSPAFLTACAALSPQFRAVFPVHPCPAPVFLMQHLGVPETGSNGCSAPACAAWSAAHGFPGGWPAGSRWPARWPSATPVIGLRRRSTFTLQPAAPPGLPWSVLPIFIHGRHVAGHALPATAPSISPSGPSAPRVRPRPDRLPGFQRPAAAAVDRPGPHAGLDPDAGARHGW